MENKKIKRNIYLKYIFVFINFAFIGGLIEALSYFNDGMFTFMQTGNLISIFYNAFNGNRYSYIYPLISLIIFIFGILLILFLKKRIIIKKHISYNTFSIVLLLILSFLYLFIPRDLIYEGFNFSNLLSIFVNTFFGIVLLNTFTYFNDIVFVPTMMTNNIRMVTSLFFKYEEEHNKVELKKFESYLTTIISFIVGVALSFTFLSFKDQLFSINIRNFEFNQNFIYLITILLLIVNLVLCYKIKPFISIDGKIKEWYLKK